MNKLISILPTYLARICALIIMVMPFHAFLTVYGASVLGHYTLLRLWKEGLLLILVSGAGLVVAGQPRLRNAIRREPLMALIGIYILMLLAIGLIALAVHEVSLKALAYGMLLDSRYLIFFVVTWLVTQYDDLLVRHWKRLVLLPASIVVGFAALQSSLLSADFLKHFGYGPHTIVPSETIDQKSAYTRVQSTLRGANPLGAYLVVIITVVSGLLLRTRQRQTQLLYAVFFVLGGLALCFTFSRSAWLGLLVSLLCIIWLSISSMRVRKLLIVASCAAIVGFGAMGFMLRHNDRFQNVFFHTSNTSRSATSSNFGHVHALKNGIGDIARQPWGGGTGTAGPASVYNLHPARIAENYYIQIGQEVGIVGLGVYVTISVLVMLRLWARRSHTLPRVLFVSFIGLIVVNLLSHAWSDDTLAYIWWGLAGAAMSGTAMSETSHTPVKHELHENTD